MKFLFLLFFIPSDSLDHFIEMGDVSFYEVPCDVSKTFEFYHKALGITQDRPELNNQRFLISRRLATLFINEDYQYDNAEKYLGPISKTINTPYFIIAKTKPFRFNPETYLPYLVAD